MKYFRIILQIMFIVGILLSFSGCSDEKNNKVVETKIEDIENSDNTDNFASGYEELSPEDEKAKKYAGTCPRGLDCYAPSCGSWIDINEDGHCDRGVGNLNE